MTTVESYSGTNFVLSHSIDTHPVDEWFEYHIHDNYELFCLVRGKVGYVVEGHIYKLRAGAVLLMRSSETHKLIVNESDEYERYVLNFRPEAFRGFSSSFLSPYTGRELGTKNLYLPSELDASPVSVFKKIFEEIKLLDSEDVVISNISALFSSISLAFLKKATNTDDEKNSLEKLMISYVNENLTSDISAESVSRAVHLSASQVNRIFRQITGTSLHDYILSKRLILFQKKLSEGKTALIASQECGFRDYSSFYRLYKKRFGIPPSKAGTSALS